MMAKLQHAVLIPFELNLSISQSSLCSLPLKAMTKRHDTQIDLLCGLGQKGTSFVHISADA